VLFVFQLFHLEQVHPSNTLGRPVGKLTQASMISPSDSPIIHPAHAAAAPPPEVEAEAKRFLQRFDAIPLFVGAIGLIALMYLLEQLVSPFILIIAIYMLLTPFREYRAARTMMWTAAFLFAFWFLVSLSGLLVPFILGALMAYLSHPFLTYLEIKHKIPRIWSSLLLVIVFFGALGFLGWWSFPYLAIQAENIFNKLSAFVTRHADTLDYAHLKEFLVSIGLPNDVADQLVTSQVGPEIQKWFASVPGIVFGYLQGVPKFIERTINLIIIFPISAFYFMKDWPKIGPLFLQFIPAKDRERRAKMFSNIDRVLYGFIRGQLIVATTVGILATICYYIMGIPYAGVLGILVGVTDLIPIVGIIFSGAVVVTVLALTPPLNYALMIGAVLVIFALHALEAYVIGPKIVGEGIGIPPVVMILALFIWGYFLGFLGLLIAVPATAVILLFVEEYRKLQNEITHPIPSSNPTVIP
jgi:predicted PurR-regulated permease PerM